VPRTRRLLPLAAALVALVALALAGVAPASAAAPTATPGALVLRVLAPTPAQVQWLSANTDLLEARVGADYFVLGEASVVSRLRAKGLQVRIDGRMAPLPRSGGLSRNAVTAAVYPTFFGGYHTVEAQLQHLSDVAAAYPALAKVVDYGNSWRKARGLGGYDLLAICITHLAAGDCALTRARRSRVRW
jgi:carboxypeptidase T